MTCTRCDSGVVVEPVDGLSRARQCSCVGICTRCGGLGSLFFFAFPIPGKRASPRDAINPGVVSQHEIVMADKPKGAYRYACNCPACGGVKAEESSQRGGILAFNAAQVPAKFWRSTFIGYTPKKAEQRTALDVVKDAASRGGRTERRESVALIGPPGTGKSHLCCAAIREMTLKHGRRAQFVSCPELRQKWLAAGFGAEQNDAGMVAADVLVLDDLMTGGLFDMPSNLARLEAVVEARANANRPTWWTANAEAKAVAEALGPRLWSRLGEGTAVLTVVGPDGRKVADTSNDDRYFDADYLARQDARRDELERERLAALAANGDPDAAWREQAAREFEGGR